MGGRFLLYTRENYVTWEKKSKSAKFPSLLLFDFSTCEVLHRFTNEFNKIELLLEDMRIQMSRDGVVALLSLL